MTNAPRQAAAPLAEFLNAAADSVLRNPRLRRFPLCPQPRQDGRVEVLLERSCNVDATRTCRDFAPQRVHTYRTSARVI